jgi:hypothetical protein
MTELDTLTNHIAEVVRKRVENGCKWTNKKTNNRINLYTR